MINNKEIYQMQHDIEDLKNKECEVDSGIKTLAELKAAIAKQEKYITLAPGVEIKLDETLRINHPCIFTGNKSCIDTSDIEMGIIIKVGSNSHSEFNDTQVKSITTAARGKCYDYASTNQDVIDADYSLCSVYVHCKGTFKAGGCSSIGSDKVMIKARSVATGGAVIHDNNFGYGSSVSLESDGNYGNTKGVRFINNTCEGTNVLTKGTGVHCSGNTFNFCYIVIPSNSASIGIVNNIITCSHIYINVFVKYSNEATPPVAGMPEATVCGINIVGNTCSAILIEVCGMTGSYAKSFVQSYVNVADNTCYSGANELRVTSDSYTFTWAIYSRFKNTYTEGYVRILMSNNQGMAFRIIEPNSKEYTGAVDFTTEDNEAANKMYFKDYYKIKGIFRFYTHTLVRI